MQKILPLVWIGLAVSATQALGWATDDDTRICQAGGRVDTTPQKRFEWKVTAREWTERDESDFGDFVRAIGRSRCGSITACIQSSANPLKTADDAGLTAYADCADLPYELRAYFAWKKGLPFSFVNGFDPLPGTSSSGRGETSPQGNYANARMTYTDDTRGVYVNQVLFDVCRNTNTGSWRMDPYDRAKFPGEIDGDFYPVGVDAEGIKPGTTLYNPDGHVSIVYDVVKDSGQGLGRVLLMSAHPGEEQLPYGSISRSEFGPSELSLSRHQLGHGFKRFRPYRVGRGGALEVSPNKEIGDFSLEQYQKEFAIDGVKLNFFQYVRAKIAGGIGTLVSNAAQEFSQMTADFCTRLKDRIASVEGVRQLVDQKDAPRTMPDNIFNSVTDDFWERNSTPGRDTRMRKAAVDFREQVRFYLDYTRKRFPGDEARLRELKGVIRKAIADGNDACPLSYVNTRGETQPFTIESVLRGRVLKMSFDPYQCPELRWGATDQSELRSCTMVDATKWKWYAAEQRFRNMLIADPTVKMGYTLEQMLSKNDPSVWGTWAEPAVDPFELLK